MAEANDSNSSTGPEQGANYLQSEDQNATTAGQDAAGEDGLDEGRENPGEGGDTLPEWAKTKISKLNSEAAKWRTKTRELEANLANAKTPEEFEKMQAESAAAIVAMERELIKEKYQLPEELAEVLHGSGREELEAHAKKLSKFISAKPVNATDVDGGLSPTSGGGGAEVADPGELARKYRQLHRT